MDADDQPNEPVVKECACGRSFTARSWAKLPYHKRYRWPWGEVQEYRHCVCGSTIVVQLEEGDQTSDDWDDSNAGTVPPPAGPDE